MYAQHTLQKYEFMSLLLMSPAITPSSTETGYLWGLKNLKNQRPVNVLHARSHVQSLKFVRGQWFSCNLQEVKCTILFCEVITSHSEV